MSSTSITCAASSHTFATRRTSSAIDSPRRDRIERTSSMRCAPVSLWTSSLDRCSLRRRRCWDPYRLGEVLHALALCAAEIEVRHMDPFGGWLRPIASWRFRRATTLLRKAFAALLTDRRRRLRERQPDQHGPGDLVDLLLQANLTDEQIRDQCLTFLFAGHDSTGHVCFPAHFFPFPSNTVQALQ